VHLRMHVAPFLRDISWGPAFFWLSFFVSCASVQPGHTTPRHLHGEAQTALDALPPFIPLKALLCAFKNGHFAWREPFAARGELL
jgi:hypothetical protein